MDKKNTDYVVRDYTRRAIYKYQQKFKRIHVAIRPETYALFEEKYQDTISFGKYVNETVQLLLESDSNVCGFGVEKLENSKPIKKDVNIPKEIESLVLKKYEDCLISNRPKKWATFTGIVSWAVSKRIREESGN